MWIKNSTLLWKAEHLSVPLLQHKLKLYQLLLHVLTISLSQLNQNK